jgi:lipopolysaccharide export system protein LptC
LDYDTRSQVVRTASPVHISWGSRQLDALGLIADLPASQLQLQSDVHGRFKP